LVCAALLAIVSASLLGVQVPVALLLWVAGSVLGLQIWCVAESIVLRALGARVPNRLERARFAAATGLARPGQVPAFLPNAAPASSPRAAAPGSDKVGLSVAAEAEAADLGMEVLVVDAAAPWLVHGLRNLVLSRAMLDLLEDRALAGLLAQAAAPLWSASVAGELIVWLGNLPLVAVWYVGRWLAQLGRVLAVVVGASLVLPLVLWPTGFTRWAGRLFGSVIVGLLGATLLSDGFAAAGLGLLVAWAVVPGLQALLAWEWRRAEANADQATIDAGLGPQLHEALEALSWLACIPRPDGKLRLLHRAGSPMATRAERVWRALSKT
jgi:hypothetical protein